MSSKTLRSTQLVLFFSVGQGPTAVEGDALWPLMDKAYDLIARTLDKPEEANRVIPGWIVKDPDLGEDVRLYPYSLCANDGESEVFDGQEARSIAIHIEGKFSLEVAEGVRDFCLLKFKEAAGRSDVRVAKAQKYCEYHLSEIKDWPEVA